jgi:ADP-ribose pyrophosphatase
LGYIEELRSLVGNRPLILVGAAAVVIDEQGRILLQKRNQQVWGLPGGFMELGESLEDTARREVFEETGIRVGKLSLVHIFSGAEHFQKLWNGDQFYAVTAVYLTKEIQGELKADGVESLEVGFFPLNELPDGTSPAIINGLSEFAGIINNEL